MLSLYSEKRHLHASQLQYIPVGYNVHMILYMHVLHAIPFSWKILEMLNLLP